MHRLLIAATTALAISACVPSPREYLAADSAAGEASRQEVPILNVLENGNILVHFPRGGCSVLFAHDGTLIKGGKFCDDVTLHRARVAVRAHIAERKADFLDV